MRRDLSFDSIRTKHQLIQLAHVLIEFDIVLVSYILVVQHKIHHLKRRKHRMSSDPLAPITQANSDLSKAVTDATTAIQNTVREILQATRLLKNPSTPTGEIGGLATNIENSAKAIDQLAVQLNQTTATLAAAAGPAPTSITATPNPVSIDLAHGSTQQLSVVDSDNDDVTADSGTQYTSDTPGVATVSATGLVTAVAAGSANITIVDSFGNKTTVPVTVTNSTPAPSPTPAAKTA